jgi:hypothetical protein
MSGTVHTFRHFRKQSEGISPITVLALIAQDWRQEGGERNEGDGVGAVGAATG